MEYMQEGSTTGSTTHMILCCECGVQIEPNAANMCVACLRTQVDITEGIPKQATIYFCRNCERYLQPPGAWVQAALESRELLSLCLKKVRNLNKVRLVDAGFIWTEPHSKRIKLKLTVQKEVMNGAVLQQIFIVEFTVHNHMCEDCHRVEAKDYWRACVQVRQKTNHKKTLYYLEQLILKHRAHANTTGIKTAPEGIDFFYAQKQDARKFIEFLQATVPCRFNSAQELISHDTHNNTYDYKHTFCAEIVPICKDNIVCLPKKLAQQLGNIGQICLCYRVTRTVHLLDPKTLQIADVQGATYWRTPFVSLCHPKQLTEFIVMEVEIVLDKDKPHVAGQGQLSHKHVLADLWVVKSSELGSSDKQYHCRTHIGHLLNPGDSVLGLDMSKANINNQHLDLISEDKLPDVVIVKKLYSDPNKRAKSRKWKLRHITDNTGTNMETGSIDREYNDFLEDLEEDPDIRQNVNIYKDTDKLAVESEDTDDEGIPRISLQEMLEDLHLGEDATGGEGADMVE